MANYLKMQKRQQVLALLELGWTYRRIESETRVRRETMSRFDRLRRSNPAKVTAWASPKAAKVTAGSTPPARSAAAPFHDAIVEKLEQGLTAQRSGST